MTDNCCKDCCCAQSWTALGLTAYTGKSIPEHIESLVTERDEARAAFAAVNVTFQAAITDPAKVYAERDEARNLAHDWKFKHHKSEVEAKRLREALEKIANWPEAEWAAYVGDEAVPMRQFASDALRYGSGAKEVRHAVTCQRFPDPYDERDAGPDVPCTCGAKEGENG